MIKGLEMSCPYGVDSPKQKEIHKLFDSGFLVVQIIVSMRASCMSACWWPIMQHICWVPVAELCKPGKGLAKGPAAAK